VEKIILYVDDAAYAAEHFAQLARDAGADGARQWILVGCAPRLTQHISKWVTHSARENWRGKWFAKLRTEVEPVLRTGGSTVMPVLAKGPLLELTQKLRVEHGAARVIDARRPKVGVNLEPVAPELTPAQSGWAVPGAVAGMGALLVLANELAE